MTIADGFVLLTIWEFEFICVIHQISSIIGRALTVNSYVQVCKYDDADDADHDVIVFKMEPNFSLKSSIWIHSALISVNHLVNAMLPHLFKYLWFLNPTAHN
jgi:hypothetical protein